LLTHARAKPPHGGETTKVEADEPAAAEQLEEELVDAADEAEASSKPPVPAKKRGRPAKAKAAVKPAADVVEDEAVEAPVDDAVDADAVANTDTQYWLMKAEQIDREETLEDGSTANMKFTIDDLRAKAGPEPWDGVRNAVACKNMREMKQGDQAFFYASGGKKGLVPGITGIMEIVKE